MLHKSIHAYHLSMSSFSKAGKLNFCHHFFILCFLLQNLFHLHLCHPLNLLTVRFSLLQTHFLALCFHPIPRKFHFVPDCPSVCYYLLFWFSSHAFLLLLLFVCLFFGGFFQFSFERWTFPLFHTLFFTDFSNSFEEQTWKNKHYKIYNCGYTIGFDYIFLVNNYQQFFC